MTIYNNYKQSNDNLNQNNDTDYVDKVDEIKNLIKYLNKDNEVKYEMNRKNEFKKIIIFRFFSISCPPPSLTFPPLCA